MTDQARASFGKWRPLMDGLAAGIHPLRWQAVGIEPGAVAALTANPRARRTLSLRLDWLDGPLAGEGPDAMGWPEWSAWQEVDATAAALASETELQRCGLRLGATVFRERLARLVLGRDIVPLKAAIGADAYFFALRQGLLVREVTGLSCEPGAGLALADAIADAGRTGLAAWLASLPKSLACRVAMKMPPEIDAAFGESAGWEEETRRAWQAAMRRVFSLTLARG